ncbi:hypothetical protein V9K67_05920 [Paraflavisolibacter sp. H34]|uniref:hypothetical protein n=1 Tax=Huijunlia imazamoxiresistens TaxID=3127457 RepID=UPI003017BE22
MAKQSTKGLLQEIASGDLEQVYISIYYKAVDWAVAGFLQEANSLLEQLWKSGFPHSRHLRLADEGFQVLWELSGRHPSHVPFPLKSIAEIEADNWSGIFYPCGEESYRQEVLAKPFSELSGGELFFKAVNAGYDGSEKTEAVLAALKKYVTTENAIDYTYFHATTCGALLAARNDRNEEAEYFIKLWGEGYRENWVNYVLAYLMRDRKSGSYLLKGILAPLFGWTSEGCRQETADIMEALTRRMKTEPQRLANKFYAG